MNAILHNTEMHDLFLYIFIYISDDLYVVIIPQAFKLRSPNIASYSFIFSIMFEQEKSTFKKPQFRCLIYR